jgi:hypothetical protein
MGEGQGGRIPDLRSDGSTPASLRVCALSPDDGSVVGQQPAWHWPDLPCTRPPLQGGTASTKEMGMPPQTLKSRVVSLETRVARLEQLPARIDDLTSQISQLRTEMRDEFSGVRTEIAATTDRLEAKTDSLATQMRVLHEDVIARITLLQEGLSGPANRKPRKK